MYIFAFILLWIAEKKDNKMSLPLFSFQNKIESTDKSQ